MLKTTKKMIEECDNLMKEAMGQISVGDLLDADDNTIGLIRGMMQLYDTSKILMLEQAQAFEDINDKLDLLLKREAKAQ